MASRQGAPPNSQTVTLLTDLPLADHTDLDKHIQMVMIPRITLMEWRDRLKNKLIQIKAENVWLAVGNSQISWNPDSSPCSQMKKLIFCVINSAGRKLKSIVVTSIIPRPDHEVLLEDDVRRVNIQFQDAVKEANKARNMLRKTKVLFIPTHKLFLENYRYFDFATAKVVTQTRIIKPHNKYFVTGTPQLNPVGLYHLRSYVLKRLHVLGDDVNSWVGVPLREEPPELQREKKAAWAKAQQFGEMDVQVAVQSDSDTELEDEEHLAPPHVIYVQPQGHTRQVLPPITQRRDEQSSEVSSTTTSTRRPQVPNNLVVIDGRRVQAWDHNVDFDETDP